MKNGTWWKLLGAAGILGGVAATGVVAARRERERRSYSPEQIRDRLQQRFADLAETDRAEATTAWRERRSDEPASAGDG